MHCDLKNVENGDNLKGFYLVKSVQQGMASNNKPFWSIKLGDASGQLDCKIWSPLAEQFKEIPTGSFASIESRAQLYRDNIQLTINEFRLLEQEEVNALDLSNYVATSPYPQDEMLDELYKIIKKHITYAPWKKFVKLVMADEHVEPYFASAPGAKSVHHAYLNGLLEHTLFVCKNCLSICANYPQLDKQVLLVAALFHDVGKIQELSGALATEYTNRGKLIGHISIGMELFDKYLEKAKIDEHLALHFKHLILSHHGELEYGSPKTPATAEAFILHYADNIDAKIAQIFAVLSKEEAEVKEDKMAWSPWNNYLNRQLCRVAPTPDKKEAEEKDEVKEKSELEQLSLI